MTGPFDAAYAKTPPWDIGRAQPALAAALEALPRPRRLLDVGCGTGDLALHAADLGIRVLGVDVAPRAVERARDKAARRGLAARFEVHDALALASLRETFDAAVDCGTFHTMNDPARERYVRNLAAVLRPAATLHLLCFSDREPDWGGPRRISRAEIERTFALPFAVERIEPATFETRSVSGGAKAWYARIVHVGTVRSIDN
jgi:cyclopropane fatty-acyl-phospholipid synthase-like methyltransferase